MAAAPAYRSFEARSWSDAQTIARMQYAPETYQGLGVVVVQVSAGNPYERKEVTVHVAPASEGSPCRVVDWYALALYDDKLHRVYLIGYAGWGLLAGAGGRNLSGEPVSGRPGAFYVRTARIPIRFVKAKVPVTTAGVRPIASSSTTVASCLNLEAYLPNAPTVDTKRGVIEHLATRRALWLDGGDIAAEEQLDEDERKAGVSSFVWMMMAFASCATDEQFAEWRKRESVNLVRRLRTMIRAQSASTEGLAIDRLTACSGIQISSVQHYLDADQREQARFLEPPIALCPFESALPLVRSRALMRDGFVYTPLRGRVSAMLDLLHGRVIRLMLEYRRVAQAARASGVKHTMAECDVERTVWRPSVAMALSIWRLRQQAELKKSLPEVQALPDASVIEALPPCITKTLATFQRTCGSEGYHERLMLARFGVEAQLSFEQFKRICLVRPMGKHPKWTIAEGKGTRGDALCREAEGVYKRQLHSSDCRWMHARHMCALAPGKYCTDPCDGTRTVASPVQFFYSAIRSRAGARARVEVMETT